MHRLDLRRPAEASAWAEAATAEAGDIEGFVDWEAVYETCNTIGWVADPSRHNLFFDAADPEHMHHDDFLEIRIDALTELAAETKRRWESHAASWAAKQVMPARCSLLELVVGADLLAALLTWQDQGSGTGAPLELPNLERLAVLHSGTCGRLPLSDLTTLSDLMHCDTRTRAPVSAQRLTRAAEGSTQGAAPAPPPYESQAIEALRQFDAAEGEAEGEVEGEAGPSEPEAEPAPCSRFERRFPSLRVLELAEWPGASRDERGAELERPRGKPEFLQPSHCGLQTLVIQDREFVLTANASDDYIWRDWFPNLRTLHVAHVAFLAVSTLPAADLLPWEPVAGPPPPTNPVLPTRLGLPNRRERAERREMERRPAVRPPAAPGQLVAAVMMQPDLLAHVARHLCVYDTLTCGKVCWLWCGEARRALATRRAHLPLPSRPAFVSHSSCAVLLTIPPAAALDVRSRNVPWWYQAGGASRECDWHVTTACRVFGRRTPRADDDLAPEPAAHIPHGSDTSYQIRPTCAATVAPAQLGVGHSPFGHNLGSAARLLYPTRKMSPLDVGIPLSSDWCGWAAGEPGSLFERAGE
jgi:hypothetical protein